MHLKINNTTLSIMLDVFQDRHQPEGIKEYFKIRENTKELFKESVL